jgi:F-type H+-transporting ATPase subunit a
VILGLEFPPISHVTEWPALFFKDTPFAVNKVVLLMWISAAIAFGVLYLGGRKRALVPIGVQNVAESAVDFVQDSIILQTMGPDGLPWTPFMLTLFSFILTCNIWGLVPGVQMPVNARIALPAFMAILVWLLFNIVGVVKQGPLKYLKGIAFPPGVPKALYILITPIEIVSVFLVRPLSLSVRLFANMLAGHLLLGTFAILSAALFEATKIGAVLPFALLVGLSGFEILVAFLQAYIFTILAAVFIGGAMHPEH